jgi:glyoxylase-like metal-dependent hydrolase (beta-lactamase superfamily II)
MKNATHSLVLAALVALSSLAGCKATGHPHAAVTTSSVLPRGGDLEAVIDEPGPVTVETVVSADWVVDRAGLINLDHPAAKAAHLTSGDEPIQVIFHAVRHPTRGLFLVDSGVERAFRDAPSHAVIRGMASGLAHLDKMTLRTLTGDYLAAHGENVRGVFLTHLHVDHVLGLRDVPASAPVLVGPGDASERSFENLFVSGIFDESLEGKGPLEEWAFRPDPRGSFEGLLDVFGDGSFWALSVPGHTPGSTAYVARTPSGPVLLTGDACHTAWGWEHGVEPGSFSSDRSRSAASLAALKKLVARHPAIDVRLGHQQRGATLDAK